MAGRPSKLTPETQKTICKAIENGATYKDAAAVAGVHYASFSLWMKTGQEATRKNKYSRFFDAVEHSKAKCFARMAEVIKQAADGGDWRAAETYLKRRDPDNWGDKQNIDHTSGGKEIKGYAIVNPDDWDDGE